MQDKIDPIFDNNNFLDEEELLEDVSSVAPRDDDMSYLYDENQRLKQELEYTKALSKQNFEQSITQFAESALAKYKQAETNYRIALESDDKALLADAAIALNHATITVNDAQKYLNDLENNTSNNVSETSEQYNYDEQISPVDRWIENYPELKQNSSRYNPQIVEKISAFSDKVIKNYQAHNREDLIGSQQYVNQLENYMVKLLAKNTNMQPIYQNRNPSNTVSLNNTSKKYTKQDIEDLAKFQLTPETMLMHLGLSKENFLKYTTGDYDPIKRREEFDMRTWDY